ncbi:MAG: DUF2177 family protein [Myxococcota bacterium]|nr:DUF2177 family protein [Myxococcota bacterium]
MMIVKRYFISIAVFVMVDAFWLGTVASSFYAKHLGHLMRESFAVVPAVLFYLIFLAGLNFFVLAPHWKSSYKKIAAYGAAFGFVTYATFDLTSQAVFKDFPTIVVVVDLIWGTVLSTSIALGTTFLYRKIWGMPQE